MSAEDEEIKARISDLRNRINRHKNQQAGTGSRMAKLHPSNRDTPTDGLEDSGNSSNWRRGTSHPYRGYYHGFSGGRTHLHRHRSLVLNGNQQAKPGESDSASDTSSAASWVMKNDRHLQLINSSVYEKEAKARTRAIEQTRQQKQAIKNERERLKLIKHINRIHSTGTMAPPGQTRQSPANRYEVTVNGIRFVVAKNGGKLIKVPGASHPSMTGPANSYGETDVGNSAQATPKMALVGGVRFYRSKNGNLYRHGIVKAQRYVSRMPAGVTLTRTLNRQSGAVKKVNVPCKNFSLTGNSISKNYRGPRPGRRGRGSVSLWEATDHVRAGSCLKGPRCRYIHDPAKVAVCKDFLQQGECLDGDNCDLSHDPTPERTPACLHYAKDSCTKPNCRYTHVKVSPGAPVCRAFGFYGYCEQGADCPERHVFECPDFSNTGICKTKGCKLPHRERASALRKANLAKDSTEDGEMDDEMEDVSSDDDENTVDSDDVDSDEVDEFIGQDGDADLAEVDYIEL